MNEDAEMKDQKSEEVKINPVKSELKLNQMKTYHDSEQKGTLKDFHPRKRSIFHD